MTLVETFIQIALPLLLLALFAFLPSGALCAYISQLVGTGLFLAALGLVALWAGPPLWLFRVYAIAFLLTIVSHFLLGRVPMAPIFTTDPAQLASSAGFIALAIAGGWLSVEAYLARLVPEAQPADIATPFASGQFIIAHGGSRTWLNPHLKTLSSSSPGHSAYRGQSYALDIFKLDQRGLRGPVLGSDDPVAYETFGAEVIAPCSGRVIAARSDLADNRLPHMDKDHLEGNFVLLRCDTFEILLAHLRKGSVIVDVGQFVKRGQVVGQVGNSGNSSEPHLHIHAQRPSDTPEAPFAARPVPLLINGRFLVRNDRFAGSASQGPD